MSFSNRVGGPLSHRLNSIRSHYQNEEHVYDIGCDHGHLGLSFLNEQSVKEIHFVDPSGPVIDELNSKLKDSYISKPVLNIHHKEGQNLTISSSSNHIFIAGMGGKEIFQIISHLLPQLDSSSMFTISPHRWVRELRDVLRSMPIGLVREELIFENDRFYEIISLKPGEDLAKISKFGDQMWEGEIGKNYQKHQLQALKEHKDQASLEYINFLYGLKY